VTLIVEDGTGLENAESYTSVAEADTFHAKQGNSSSWVDGFANGILHIVSQPTDGDTFLIDAKTFTMQGTLTDVDGNVAIGADIATTRLNIHGAINNDVDIPGTTTGFAASTTKHPTVEVTSVSNGNVNLQALTDGTPGNAIVTTSIFNDDLNHFEDVTLTGATENKEIALRQATQYLDDNFSSRWRGSRLDRDQSLNWPRVGANDDDGFHVDSDEVPIKIKDATSILALSSLTESLQPDITQGDSIKSKRTRIGPLEVARVFTGGDTQKKQFVQVNNLIRGFIFPPGQLRRG